jgi:tRNA A-37 threonylcarbamoyl transferase component Bud32
MPATLGKDEELADRPTYFGRYSIVRELGKGGMAEVFEARHTELDRRVALKVMHPSLAAHRLAAARFLREAKAACHIRHQHVVEVFDIGTDHGLPYIVMELLEGSNLAALLVEKGPLTLSGIANIFLPVLSAVAAAHAAGVIHRDLKPANLMLAKRPPRAVHPMVLDFGISKIANEELDNTLTRSEALLGTVQYMAPELTKGAKFASPASDQYALGIMLYECATGRRPFTGQSHYELMHAIVTAPVALPSELRPDLPREFDALVGKAMHRDPAIRFPSIRALGSALLSFGDRAEWALWEHEFIGMARAVELWTTDGSTLHDASQRDRATDRAWSWRRTDAARALLARTAFTLVAIYAAVVTAMLARRSTETTVGTSRESAVFHGAETFAPASPASNVAGSGQGTSTAPNFLLSGEILTVRERLADDRASSASERPNPLEPTVSSVGSETVRPAVKPPPIAWKVQAAPTPRSTLSHAAPAPPVVPDSKTPPKPTIHEGTNGAPIVD